MLVIIVMLPKSHAKFHHFPTSCISGHETSPLHILIGSAAHAIRECHPKDYRGFPIEMLVLLVSGLSLGALSPKSPLVVLLFS